MNWRIFAIVFAVLLFFQSFPTNGSTTSEKKTASEAGKPQVDKKEAKSKEEPKKPKFIGYVDKNKDGINDKFHDTNGDGTNDVTKEKYNHRFKFVDKNKDKINDVFVDKDGDGVNDLGTEFVDEDKDSINSNVLDFDKDGVNDITGLKYKNEDLMGYRYGIVEEEIKRTHKKFIDKNGDGMHDLVAIRRGFIDKNGDGINDRFIDKDGDGICDDRWIGRYRYHRGRRMMPHGGRRMMMRRRRR